MGNIYETTGEGEKALSFFQKSLNIKEDLVEREPYRTDLKINLAITYWNMFLICPQKDKLLKLLWLEQAETILKPLREGGLLHGQLEKLWGLVGKELSNRKRI